MRKKAVLFDNDNTIVDTEPLHLEARQIVCSRWNTPLTRDDYIQYWMGRPVRVGIERTFPTLGESEWKKIHQVITEEYDHLREKQLSLVPGFLQLLRTLDRRGYMLAIASTLSQESIRRGLELVFEPEDRALFRHIVSGEDVTSHKPAPDVWLLAAEHLGVTPEECIAIEDSTTGVESVRAAGMLCIARVSEWSEGDALLKAGADLLCHDYGVLAGLFDLP